MSRDTNDDGDRLVRYLLGLMSEEEKTELEEVYLTDDVLNEQLQAAEREVIDKYIDGDLSGTERKRFESFFLCSPGRKEKLRFARALRAYGAKRERLDQISAADVPRVPAGILRSFAESRISIAVALLAIGVGIVIWRVVVFRSPEQEAMLALSRAYDTGRLFEGRISGLKYIPMAQTRGDGAGNSDSTSLKQAELIALTEAGEHPGSRAFHTLGRVYLVQQRFDEALEWLRKAAEADPEHAGIQSDLGIALFEHGRHEPDHEKRAREMARSFDHLGRALQLDDSLLEARFNRALWYEYWHLPERAVEEWRAYLERDAKSAWADEARQRLAALEEKKKSSRNKERDFEEFVAAVTDGNEEAAWKVFSRNRDRSGNVIVQRLIDEYIQLSNEGTTGEAGAKLRVLSAAGQLEIDRAGDRFTSDLAGYYLNVTPTQRKLLKQGRTLLSLAFESYRKAGFDKAIRLYREAASLFARAGDDCEMASSRSWLGACYLRVPDSAQALGIFQFLAQFSSRRSYKLLLAQSLLNIADARTSRREFSKSLDNAARVREICESIQDATGVLGSIHLYASVNLQFGDFYKSTGFALHALDIAGAVSPGPLELWPFYQQIAFNLNSLGFSAMALEFQEQALRLAEESDWPLLKSRSYALLGVIYQKLQKYDDAIKNGELALAEAQAVEGEKGRANLVANSTLNLAHVYREMGAFDHALSRYDQAIGLHRQMNLHIYLAEAHRGKLLSLIGLNDERAIAEEIREAISLLEQDRPRILEDRNRTSYFDLAQNTYDLAIDFTYSRLNDGRSAFDYSEASRARSLLDLIHSGGKVVANREGADVRVNALAPPLRLTEIQERMPGQSQILQYSVLEDKIIAWVVSRRSVESAHHAVTLAQLTEQVTAFTNVLAKPSASNQQEVRRRGEALYELLIKPVEASLEPDGVILIVPDKVLNYVPFAAIVSPESGRYFVEERVFQIAPSSSIMIGCSEQARRKSGPRDEKVLAVGNPSFDRASFPMLADLPSAAREAEQVASLYGRADTLTGQQAQADLVKARMLDAHIIHLACHHVTDDRSPMLSRLLLSKARADGDGNRDGTLPAAEVYGMDLRRTQLVVLSACGTAVERYYRGEGAIGIARPFIEAGATIVVASLWPVTSEVTCQLMIDFHRRRKLDGMSTVRALRQAQLNMLNSADPNNQDPHAWAAFTAIGGLADF